MKHLVFVPYKCLDSVHRSYLLWSVIAATQDTINYVPAILSISLPHLCLRHIIYISIFLMHALLNVPGVCYSYQIATSI